MISEHEYRKTIETLTAEAERVTALFIKDRPGYVRETGIKDNPKWKSFALRINVCIGEDFVSSDACYYAGGVNNPSTYIRENIVDEFKWRK